MSLKILLDMNLSPDWVSVLAQYGWKTLHWSIIGDPRAPDSEILQWAIENQYVVFTHDLDFGALLASSQGNAPSVIQLRTQDTLPDAIEYLVVAAINQYEDLLEKGALIIVDESKTRARILPLRR